MNPALELTSVPAWATAPCCPEADVSGRHWTVIAFGKGASEIVANWTAQILSRHPDTGPRIHWVNEDAQARHAVSGDLDDAVVGWRLMIAGPADACLRLRAHALECGVGDDEITVASTEVAIRDVRCAHCATVNRAFVDLEDVLPCAGCGRNLLVYYHVSRRLGAHFGFMVDAERPRGEIAS